MHFGSEPDAFSKCSSSGTWGGILPAGDLQTVAASPLDACSTLQNAVALKGAVAVVTRGMCGFGDKAINVQVGYDIGISRIDLSFNLLACIPSLPCQSAGAIALIIIDNAGSYLMRIGVTTAQVMYKN